MDPIKIIKFISVLAAAAILGNWYLAEYRKARILRKPWYSIYLSLPGVMIIVLILLLPVIVRFI